MIEATQVTGLGQDGQCVDRTDPGDFAQQLVVNVIGEPEMGKRAAGRGFVPAQ